MFIESKNPDKLLYDSVLVSVFKLRCFLWIFRETFLNQIPVYSLHNENLQNAVFLCYFKLVMIFQQITFRVYSLSPPDFQFLIEIKHQDNNYKKDVNAFLHLFLKMSSSNVLARIYSEDISWNMSRRILNKSE